MLSLLFYKIYFTCTGTIILNKRKDCNVNFIMAITLIFALEIFIQESGAMIVIPGAHQPGTLHVLKLIPEYTFKEDRYYN